MDLFESVLHQIDVPPTYKAHHLWQDMILYCKKNRQALKVNQYYVTTSIILTIDPMQFNYIHSKQVPFQFVLSDNLNEKNLSFDQYLHALEDKKFHGYDVALCILSRMLKMTIGVWTGRYVWLYSPNINVFEVSVLLTLDAEGIFDTTG